MSNLNRNIRVRAWKNGEKYYQDGKYFTKESDPEIGYRFEELFFSDDCLIERFAGINDIHGDEIYEGDIVKSWVCLGPAGEEQVVHDVKIGPWGVNIQKWAYNHGLYAEIIGNIHEDPELLQQK